jgi:hypothetical protein
MDVSLMDVIIAYGCSIAIGAAGGFVYAAILGPPRTPKSGTAPKELPKS